MDKEMPVADTTTVGAEAAGRTLPKGGAFLSSVPNDSVTAPEGGERTGVFRQLVSDDSDIAGLVAYSIYKQNKLDWLTAFERTKARAPNDDELASYIIGEGTPRRLATYRHLAEATLAGNGPEVASSTGKGLRPGARRAGTEKSAVTPKLIGLYVLVAILFLAGFLVAAHYTMTSR